ncbi:alpha/beta hydrolase family protein [Novosphingobium cyanobacteriorum]|uniref:Alpha/beta fold hydrolase n=1 Tax=Novosphingobium cyanobacteriorum TaxID=3024215 RepID=A0ABT6CP75_9SPHN|nr:alpha/beta fold hydrolase [Novosphingobium cyanobacteriorum]MDF8334112.1 alpha/beta fold hydrolase [Novosphingobium cyanobacteriorum]
MRNPGRLMVACLMLGAGGQAQAADLPPAIYTDPPADAAHPARMEVLHILSGGVAINGVAYLAAGAGPHPTVVVCHGLPGNEKNLDLAQALRRQGWNAITFNYRGSWGSPGQFRFGQNPQDARAALAFLRDPANATRLGVDTARMAMVGHSMGGWVTAMAGSEEPALRGLVMISAADFGMIGTMPDADRIKLMDENRETLAVAGPGEMAAEVAAHAATWDYVTRAEALKQTPLLVLTSDDGLATHGDVLVAAVRKAGGDKVQAAHVATDHSWSDRRIELEARVIHFLEPLLAR